MSMREHIGVQLGFIALSGALSLVLVLALLGDRVKAPSFEHSLQELDWRAIRADDAGAPSDGVSGGAPGIEA